MDVLSDDEFDHVRDFDMTDSDSDGEYADHHGTPSTTPPRMQTPGRAGRKIIPCPYHGCSKAFNRNSRLQEHVRSHTGERPFKCPHASCPKAFLRDSHLKHHVTSAHSNIRNYPCAWEGCDKKFATGTRLRRHLQAHQGREKYRCRGYDGCNETFRKHETLKRHILTVHEKKKAFPCDRILSSGEPCDQAYDTADGLKNHQRAMHDTSRFSCTICATTTAASSTASSAPSPNDAGVQTSDSSPASLHAFETWHDLQEHIQQAHLATCELCSQSFNTNKQLTKHLETVHAIVDPTKQHAKQFPCPFDACNHVFTKRGNLNVHVRTVHEKKKDFVCGTTDVPVPDELGSGHGVSIAGCGRSFTSKASLVEHIRVAHFNLPTKRQQREANKRAKRQAESDLSSPPVVKRRKPRKDKGLKKSSTVASLSGLRNDAPPDSGLTSFPPFSYASPTQPNGRRVPDNLMDDDTDEWNQLSGSMTLFGDHLYHNGQGYHLVSEDGSADQTRFDDGQYMPCDEPEPGMDMGEDMDTEPFFHFEHERELVYNHIDPMLQQA